MHSVLVVNPKGGAGKTTVATNLAGGLAQRGEDVYLWDLDRQQSSLTWLSMRPPHLPVVNRLDQRDEEATPALGKGRRLIVDSPAGFHGKSLTHNLKFASKVLIPVQPSLFDMSATGAFLQVLGEEKAIRRSKSFVGIIGVRVDPRTRAAATLEAFLEQFELPVLTYLRDSQIYPNAAFNGMSIFDLPTYLSQRDVDQWAPVLDWVSEDD
ncbi:MAG: ParA family protein [Betaproteobacteria bacterium]